MNGLHFLGPIRGILPIGPDGVPAFDTLKTSVFSDDQTRAAMLSYNYTLQHQGLTSNVSCIYDTQSPITFGRIDGETDSLLQYNRSCQGRADILNSNHVNTFVSVNADNGLGYWTCKSLPDIHQEQAYYVDLRGRSNYTDPIGNITCTITPIQPAIFPITYQSRLGVFTVKDPISTAPITFPQLIELALVSLGSIIHESQNWEANLVPESVITTAVKSFGLPPYERSSQVLRLFGAMIQGILEYELTYNRLIYSTVENPPASCIREVQGTTTYQVLGWSVTLEHVGFLMPMTLINFVSVVIIIVAMAMAKGKARDFDPVDVRSLLPAFVE